MIQIGNFIIPLCEIVYIENWRNITIHIFLKSGLRLSTGYYSGWSKGLIGEDKE